ncbi:MAG: hypothetical protein COA86_02300 [Kangiella sp.]|nr:MAG: hypothetical protein COA86_02300 [Kangiella sp.]
MIDCEQISHLLFIFFSTILIGSILQLLMMALPRNTSRREKHYEKIIKDLEELDKLEKATIYDTN